MVRIYIQYHAIVPLVTRNLSIYLEVVQRCCFLSVAFVGLPWDGMEDVRGLAPTEILIWTSGLVSLKDDL